MIVSYLFFAFLVCGVIGLIYTRLLLHKIIILVLVASASVGFAVLAHDKKIEKVIQYDPLNYDPLTFISMNPKLPQEKLWQLAHYPDCEVRRSIVLYPNVSERILKNMIAEDPDIGVKHDAKNKLDFLHGVSKVKDNKIEPQSDTIFIKQLALSARNNLNPTTLVSIYNKIINQEHVERVLENLAGNCFIPQELARSIYIQTNSLESYVRSRILKALSINPNTPQDILHLLATEKNLTLLRSLASNPSLSPDIINQLAPFPDCKIRKKIICIPNTERTVVSQLKHDADAGVAAEAQARLHQETQYLTVCQEIKKLTPSCRKYYQTNSPTIRLYPNTSHNTIKAPSPNVRFAMNIDK